jgi:hypothetical protein
MIWAVLVEALFSSINPTLINIDNRKAKTSIEKFCRGNGGTRK